MDSTTQSLESLLGILHSKNTPEAYCIVGSGTTDLSVLIQKLDSIERACASLDSLHAKVDSLCAGMQLIRSELETPDLQPAPPIPTAADFVAINVREDTALASCATTPVAAVDSAVIVISTPSVAVPVPQEPAPDYTNSTDILNVLWPGVPKNDHDEFCANRIRQEAELIHEVD